MNIVRLRYGEPVYWLEIGSMLSQYTFDAGAVIITKKDGFKVDGDDYIEIDGFIFDGEERMVYWKNAIGGVLQNCEASNAKKSAEKGAKNTAIYILDASVTIDNCYVHDSADVGILVEGTSSNITIKKCTLDSNGKNAIKK